MAVFVNHKNQKIAKDIKEELDNIEKSAENDNRFLSLLVRNLFSVEEIKTTSVTGRPAKKGVPAKPAMDPIKMKLVMGMYI